MNLIAIHKPECARDPHAKMLTSHLDQIRLISASKNMQDNTAKNSLKRWREWKPSSNKIWDWSKVTWLVQKDFRSDALESFVVSSLPFKRMCEVCSAGHLQISEPGVISRKKHALDLTGLRILPIHVTQFSPKRAETLPAALILHLHYHLQHVKSQMKTY